MWHETAAVGPCVVKVPTWKAMDQASPRVPEETPFAHLGSAAAICVA